jgi:hypothetical protein
MKVNGKANDAGSMGRGIGMGMGGKGRVKGIRAWDGDVEGTGNGTGPW